LLTIGRVLVVADPGQFGQPRCKHVGESTGHEIDLVAVGHGQQHVGLGEVGPVDNYAAIPALGKWVLSFCMLLGRLEIYTVLVLFLPEFWRK